MALTPEQLIDGLRKLLGEAKKLASSAGDNQALIACIDKAEKLLASDNITTEAVTKLTAELSALMKKAPAEAVGDHRRQACEQSCLCGRGEAYGGA